MVIQVDLAAECRGKEIIVQETVKLIPWVSEWRDYIKGNGKDGLGARTTTREETKGLGRKLDIAVRDRAVQSWCTDHSQAWGVSSEVMGTLTPDPGLKGSRQK